MRTANPTAAVNFLTEFGDNLPAWMMTLQTNHSLAFERLRDAMKDVFSDLENIYSSPSQQATVNIASKERYLARPTPSWQMSDGELTFLAYLSLIFSPNDLGAPLYCVEEPETHLHPRLLDQLVEVLKQVQSELPPEQRSQIVLTTHSPHFVDKFELDELIVFEKSKGATTLSRPSSKTHLRDLLSRSEIGLGELFYTGALGNA
jgi:predicted ATPase